MKNNVENLFLHATAHNSQFFNFLLLKMEFSMTKIDSTLNFLNYMGRFWDIRGGDYRLPPDRKGSSRKPDTNREDRMHICPGDGALMQNVCRFLFLFFMWFPQMLSKYMDINQIHQSSKYMDINQIHKVYFPPCHWYISGMEALGQPVTLFLVSFIHTGLR